MDAIRGLIVEDEVWLRRALLRATPRTAAGTRIQWDEAATAAEALRKLLPQLHLVVVDVCLGQDRSNRDGLVVAYFAAQHTNAHVVLWTAHALDGDTQCELYELGIWPFSKALDHQRLLDQLAKTAAAAPRASPPVGNALAQIAALMRLVDGRISDVAKWALALAAESAMRETNRNKSRAGKLLGADRKFIERALEWLPPEPALSETRLRAALAKTNDRAPKVLLKPR